MNMLPIYLVILWLLVTAVWAGNRKLRSNGAAFLVWFALTAVVLWPVTRRVVGSEVFRTVYSEVRQELAVELEAEFGPVSEREIY